MKDRKRFLFVFAICWVIGLLGGYFLGLGSAILPSENIEYNYYFSEKAEGSDVEPINKKCTKSDNTKKTEDDNTFYVVVKHLGILEVPKRFFSKLVGN